MTGFSVASDKVNVEKFSTTWMILRLTKSDYSSLADSRITWETSLGAPPLWKLLLKADNFWLRTMVTDVGFAE